MERNARTRGAGTAILNRVRPVVAVPVVVLAIVFCVGVAASPSGSAPTSASGQAASVRQLGFFYSVKLHNIPASTNATGVLAGITEGKHGAIRGVMILAPPLYGGGPLTGSVGKTNVNFTVASTPGNRCNCKAIAFTGSVHANGAISGTYIATGKWGSQKGTWLASPHATFNCEFRSHASHKFVTDEVTASGKGLAGLLRARSPAVGTWQQFRCVAIGTDQWALRSRETGKYVTTEVGYPGSLNGLLRARSNNIGSLQKFRFSPVPSCSCLALRAANSKFVTAELNYTGARYGILRARSPKIGAGTGFDVTSS